MISDFFFPFSKRRERKKNWEQSQNIHDGGGGKKKEDKFEINLLVENFFFLVKHRIMFCPFFILLTHKHFFPKKKKFLD